MYSRNPNAPGPSRQNGKQPSRLPPPGSKIGKPAPVATCHEWPQSNTASSTSRISQPSRNYMPQPGTSFMQHGRPLPPASKIPQVGMSRIPQPGMSRISQPGVSRIPPPEASRIPPPKTSDYSVDVKIAQTTRGRITAPVGAKRGQYGSKLVTPGFGRVDFSQLGEPLSHSSQISQTIARPNATKPGQRSIKATCGVQNAAYPCAGDGKKKIFKDKPETLLQKFDRTVDEELRRRRDSMHIMLEPVSSDVELLTAVDHLVRAETVDTFTGAVRAAEEAAARASPGEAEEAAVAGARGFQAEVIDVIDEKIPGWIPIKVIGYVGITRPKFPTKSR